MNKKTISLVMMLLLAVVGAKADVIPSTYYSEPEAGTYYIYNVTEGKFLRTVGVNENNYSLLDAPVAVTLIAKGEIDCKGGGDYILSGNTDNYMKVGHWGGQWLWPNAASGNADILAWSFNSNGTKTYTMSITLSEAFSQNNATLTAGSYYMKDVTNLGSEAEAGTYALITVSDYNAYTEATYYEGLASAASIPTKYYTTTPAAGTYYLYSPYASCFLYPTADHAGLQVVPETITLTSNGDDFNIEFSNGKYLKYDATKWGNTWANGTAGEAWSFTSFHGASGLFFVKHVSANSYLYAKTTGAASWGGECWGTPETDNTRYAWALISENDYQKWSNLQTIIAAKGNATSFIGNQAFDTAPDTYWTGGTATNCNTWRGGDRDYESTAAEVTFSQTLTNMPAGTYKLVGAVRGDNGTTATAQLTNGTTTATGATITNHAFNTSYQQINSNGVQMPYSNLGGFSTLSNSLGWNWATVTYELPADGDLTINFLMTGARWKGIDDVHLYYMSDGTNTYAVEYTDDVDAANHAVTCDFQTDDPNKLFTSTAVLKNAINNNVNNNLVDGNVSNLVLYDGYEFSADADFTASAATYFRSFKKDVFCTVALPFTPHIGTGTYYAPTTFADGTLSFEAVADADLKPGTPYLLKPAGNYNATNLNATAETRNQVKASLTNTSVCDDAITLNGTWSLISNLTDVSGTNYVLGNDNKLYKVNSTVSLAPFRAYFNIPSGSATSRISLAFNDEVTGIADVYNKMEKVNVYYNLSGQRLRVGELGSGMRVSQSAKGLIIKQGKKFIVK